MARPGVRDATQPSSTLGRCVRMAVASHRVRSTVLPPGWLGPARTSSLLSGFAGPHSSGTSLLSTRLSNQTASCILPEHWLVRPGIRCAPMPGRSYGEAMIRLLISVAFALAVATSAEAMSPAPLHEPDAMITHIAVGQPCDLKSQVRIWGCPRCGVNGICMLRVTRPVRQRTYLRCVEWNEGMCVEYDKTRR